MRRLIVAVAVLCLLAAAYAARWEYIARPGAFLVRVNRWTGQTETFYVNTGWTSYQRDSARIADPFADLRIDSTRKDWREH